MLALTGYLMIGTFVALVMMRKMSALSALIIVPVAFALVLGHSHDMGEMIIDGIRKVAPTGVMLVFAILYFGIMIDAGLFDPVVRLILRVVGVDPVRIAIGTVVLASTVALDGDGTSTFLITVTAILPVYRRVGMSPYVLACLVLLSIGVMNLLPWGGHTTRVIASLQLTIEEVFNPIIPVMAVGLLYALCAAYFLGKAERKRLGLLGIKPTTGELHASQGSEGEVCRLLRPRLVPINATLTLLMMIGLMLGALPMSVLFMIGFSLAVLINYPNVELQKERVAAHASNVLATVSLLFASGIFTGLLGGTGMVAAMAQGLVDIVPSSLGEHMALITALVSMPFTYFMANDPYYFGVVPVIAEAAQSYGVSKAEIARASVLGQPVHVLSPLFAALYLLVSLLEIDFAENQKYVIRWAVGSSLAMIGTALVLGVI